MPNNPRTFYSFLSIWVFLLALFSFSETHAQIETFDHTGAYKEAWRAVDSLAAKGLYRSALEQVMALQERALREDNTPQRLKGYLYRSRFQQELEEDGTEYVIAALEAELADAGFPERHLLQSILAEVYQGYADRNRWRIGDRTSLAVRPAGAGPGEGLDVWTLEDLNERILTLYSASYNEPGLREIPIDSFSLILTPAQRAEGLRPTLYDFLAHRALDQFMNERSYLGRPAYAFTLNDPQVFSSAEQFLQLDLAHPDTMAYHLKALQTFQDLLAFHLTSGNEAALVDADLKRLQFVHDQAVFDRKDSLYLEALLQLEEAHRAHPISAEVSAEIVRWHIDLGGTYQRGVDSPARWALNQALEVARSAIERHRESYGADLCRRLVEEITQSALQLEVESVLLPERPSLMQVRYRNLSGFSYRLIPLDEDAWRRLEYMKPDSVMAMLAGAEKGTTRDVRLPLANDHQEHVTEIVLEPLSPGRYALYFTSGAEAGTTVVPDAIFFQVSHLAVLESQQADGRRQFLLADRDSGRPLSGVSVSFLEAQNRFPDNFPAWRLIDRETSGPDGLVLGPQGDRLQYLLRLELGEDVLLPASRYSHYGPYQSPAPEVDRYTHFFLDRAIYRPGQTVYFKGLALQQGEGQRAEILAGEPVTVTFFDANRQEVAQLELETNRFGSFSGSFVAPSGGLRGRMTITSSLGGSNASFRVEEYKRPRFKVVLEPLTGTPALGEDIALDGRAETYAGSAVDGALLQYRVVREVRFPWWPVWGRGGGFPPSGSQQMEIARGVATTDEEGRFSVPFTALPDRSIPEDQRPAFVFRVEVDVTSLAGETRSAGRTISLAYVGLTASLSAPAQADRQDSLAVRIVTANLDGKPQPATGTLRIYQLDAPDGPTVDRPWEKPDLYSISEREFRELFPHLSYRGTRYPGDWDRLREVYREDLELSGNTRLPVEAGSWPVGHYEIHFATLDARGKEVEVKRFFSLYDGRTQALPDDQLLWYGQPAQAYEPGDTFRLSVASSLPDFALFYRLERGGEALEDGWLTLGPAADMARRIEPEDRGNLHLQLAYVRFNRYFTQTIPLSVPWPGQELTVEYLSFRDKLRPGAEESWEIKISGPEGERVAAEMVAAMYDASLDQFVPYGWSFDPYPRDHYPRLGWTSRNFTTSWGELAIFRPGSAFRPRAYQSLQWFGFYPEGIMVAYRNMEGIVPGMQINAMADEGAAFATPPPPPPVPEGKAAEEPPAEAEASQDGPLRTNLDETVFFFPDLRTDAGGNIRIQFTMNEALTTWKFLGFAHTEALQYGLTQKEVVTQKELMVLPNAPRFVREGDELELTAIVSNLTEDQLAGTATLECYDPFSGTLINADLDLPEARRAFTAEGGRSARVAWRIKIPSGGVQAIQYRVMARAGNFADGEQNAIPVLTNRILLTETMPLPVRGKEQKTFSFDRMRELAASESLQHQGFTLEFTTNPVWYAVKSLPYLMEFPHECIEQEFNRLYANSLAAAVVADYPKIRDVFRQWKDQGALKSQLTLNQELKSALLEETPWVLQAQSETEQRHNIALLFDLDRMAKERAEVLRKLRDRQLESGGWSWFPGGREDRYMTQYIVEGMGRMRQLGLPVAEEAGDMLGKAVRFMDDALQQTYDKLREDLSEEELQQNHLGPLAIHYLYARSFFPDVARDDGNSPSLDFYLQQAKDYWLQQGLYQQGMLALALWRYDQRDAANEILRSLEERALHHEELGMYWKYARGYSWYQRPLETHALMIEVFAELAKNERAVEDLQIWLIRHKQTTHWETTKATAAALYALLSAGGGMGSDWLMETQPVQIRFPGLNRREYTDRLKDAQSSAEAATGYFKTNWSAGEVEPGLGEVRVKNPNRQIAWGALYWQYFEEMDKVTAFEDTPLQLKKTLFRQELDDTGPILAAVGAGMELAPGDRLIVRIELRVDRDMEYVHMKDLRASGLEPEDVLSRYQWQDGLGYYQSTGDVATHFFFGALPRGTYIFEYPLRVSHLGDFAAGITTIQSMYAPEFTSHSEGVRLRVDRQAN